MASDILEQAKDALDHAISESSGGVYLDPSCNDLLPICRELIAEVERLRSLNESLMENGNDLRTRCQKAETRIKELEEANRNIDKRRDEMAAFIERLEAAFLEAETKRWERVYPNDLAEREARAALEELICQK